MKIKFFLSIITCLLLLIAVTGCAEETAVPDDAVPDEIVPVEEKDTLVFGGVRPLSGPMSFFEEMAFGPIYKMWVNEVNERGGIYVEEYGKQLPIELLIYDDTSDLGTMTRLLERLMVEDEVDFLLPPAGTAWLHAAAPIANEHGYLLLGAEGGAAELEPMMAGLPYFFSILNYCRHQVPPLVDILVDAGVESVAILFIADLHGIEYSGRAIPLLEVEGIEVVFSKSIPPGIDDLSAHIEEARAAGVDGLLCFAYPDENFLLVGQCLEMGYSPDVLLLGPGGNFEVLKAIFGPNVEGIMSWGAFNSKSSPEAADFVDRFIEVYNGPELLDWWGHLPYYASLQVLEQAIEIAGTIDHSVLKDVIATERFDTVMGTVWFEGGGLPAECYAGQVGQWQDGVFEVIGPPDQATALPIIPKPPWPTQ